MASRRPPQSVPNTGRRNRHPDYSEMDYFTFPPLQGFEFDDKPQSNSLLTILETPVSRFQSDGRLNSHDYDENMYSAQDNLILLFRTANFYIHFRDMPQYMYAIAEALSWPYNICESIFHQYIAARELFLVRNPVAFAAVAQLMKGKVKLICRLVDDIRLAPPAIPWQITEYRTAFFQQVRDYWQGSILQTATPFDPGRAFPTPDIPEMADWLYPRGASLFVDCIKHPGPSHTMERLAASHVHS